MSENRHYVGVPDGVKEAPEKYFAPFMALLFVLRAFPPDKGTTLREFFSFDDDWTEEDTDYTIAMFAKHGVISLD